MSTIVEHNSTVLRRKKGRGVTDQADLPNQEMVRGSIPSFFVREISVVRLRPMRSAAPCGPASRVSQEGSHDCR